ncbi:hypothetical protein N656DRAFT_828231 [Canariomyces notabilis]|uniref:Ilp is an apoptosis inhibitor n=1 Tax=Canariomyces notabilis TaxID=2074819 RepID=A0AAN6TFX7_9PEZI|nr:hypothetical protein N656DRAFT_828231 [Canariomyces arenarius]
MAMPQEGDQSFQEEQPFLDAQFDIFDWHPYFQSCLRYFLEHAQYNGPVQALAAFINIQLPFQKAAVAHTNQFRLSRSGSSPSLAQAPGFLPTPPAAAAPFHHSPGSARLPGPVPVADTTVLQPYIRRLVATGFDIPAVLHGFFGDDWRAGIGPVHEQERRNFLFAAKSGSWLDVKRAYDMGQAEAVPFLKPLRNVTEAEIVAAESAWSEWLAMQDWMLGPRAPEARTQPVGPGAASMAPGFGRARGRVHVKQEED